MTGSRELHSGKPSFQAAAKPKHIKQRTQNLQQKPAAWKDSVPHYPG